MSVLTLLGWPFVLAGLLSPFIVWMVLGLYGSFENRRDQEDWLWSGLLAGVLCMTLYVMFTVPGI